MWFFITDTFVLEANLTVLLSFVAVIFVVPAPF